MGQDPAAIRKEIDQTREHMGATVDALGYKADVPARAKDSVSEKVDSLKSKVAGAGAHVSHATPSAGEVREGAQQAAGVLQENPLGVAIGAAALGFLAGMLVPSTRLEDERVGPLADQVKEQAQRTGAEALEHGKQVVQETAETATQKAQEAVADVKEKAEGSGEVHAQQTPHSVEASAEQANAASGSFG